MIRASIAAVAIVPCMIALLPAFVIAAALAAFAAVVRRVARTLERPFVSWVDLMAFDPRLGWKPRPHLDCHYLALHDDVFRVVTDAEGWPGRRPLDDSDLVVIGDSFAFGYGMDTDRSFAALLPGVRVKGVGAPGYSMVHGVRLMEQFGRRLSGKLVVWFAYLENDLQDNLVPEMVQYRAPFVRFDRASGRWDIVDEHVGPRKWTCSNLDTKRLFPGFCVPGPRADRAYGAAAYLIGRAQQVCQQAGATLVLVTIPHSTQLTESGRAELASLSGSPARCDAGLPDRRIAEACGRYAVPMVAAKERLGRGEYKRREGIHWSARGHRRIADLLAELYDAFRSGSLDEYVPRQAPESAAEAAMPVALRRQVDCAS